MPKSWTPIDVKDAALASIALKELVQQGSNSKIGLDDSTRQKVKDLAELPFTQAVEIATESIKVHVSLDEEAFEAAMRKKRILSSEQDYYEWMISIGASNSLLKTLFPALSDSSQNAILRRSLNAGGVFKKVSLIHDEAVKNEVAEQYHSLSQQLKLQPYERIRELYLHYQGKYNLTQLYAVLKEYDLI